MIKDFDFGNILLDEKSYETILVDDILYKTLTGAKPLHQPIKYMNLLEFIMELDI